MIYFILDESALAVKIGHGSNLRDRLSNLQAGNPRPLSLVAWRPGGRKTERKLHERFAADRIRGEWFRVTDDLCRVMSRAKWHTTEGLIFLADRKHPRPPYTEAWRERAFYLLVQQYADEVP